MLARARRVNQLVLLESLHESKVACDILIPPLTPPPPPTAMDVGDSPLRSSLGMASSLTRRPRVVITPGPNYINPHNNNNNNNAATASSGRTDNRGAPAAVPSSSAFIKPAFEARAAGDPISGGGGGSARSRDGRIHLRRGSSESVLQDMPSEAAAAASTSAAAAVAVARDRGSGSGGVGAFGDDLGRSAPPTVVASRVIDGRGSRGGGGGIGGSARGGSQAAEVTAEVAAAAAEKEDCFPRTAGQGFREGDLQCGRKYSRRFSLNHRLHGATVLHELRRTALAPFAVQGRSGLYVYLDRRRNIFYMTLSEVRTGV